MEQPTKALRYNAGKLRYNLIPENAKRELARVYTLGAHKYSTYLSKDGKELKGSEIPFSEVGEYKRVYDGANNWRLGTKWSAVMDSAMRHIESFKSGEDYDELGTLHLSNAVWNLMTILEYQFIYPQGDDRQKRNLLAPKIALDIDEVIADWVSAYCYKYELDIPKCWNFDRKIGERCEELWKDKDFWMGIRPKTFPDNIPFEPVAYVTSRHIPTEWTEEWLDLWKFPIAPVISTAGRSKVEAVRESGATVFVDDNFETFRELNNAGICCYLFSAAHNLRYNVGDKRIESLKDLYWFKGMEINQTKINYEKKD